MRTVLALFAVLACATTAQAKPNALLDDWNTLVNSGCDLAKHAVRTPIEASVLRNTPYAMAGYAFKSKGLRALFSADGGWYTPKSKTTPKFHSSVTPCIKKLKALEAKMRAQVNVSKAVKEKIFANRTEYLNIRQHSRYMGRGTSTLKPVGQGFGVRCADCAELRYYQVICFDFANDCSLVVPGTGDIPD